MSNETEKPKSVSRLKTLLSPGREIFAGGYLGFSGWMLHALSSNLNEDMLNRLGPLADTLASQIDQMQQDGSLQGTERMLYFLGSSLAIHGGTRMYQDGIAYTAPVRAYFATFHPRLYKAFFSNPTRPDLNDEE